MNFILFWNDNAFRWQLYVLKGCLLFIFWVVLPHFMTIYIVFFIFFRENTPRHNTSTGSSRTSSHNYSPLSVSPHLSPKGPGFTSPGYSPAGSALTPVYSAPMTPIDSNYFESYEYEPGKKNEDQEDIHVTKQVRFFMSVFLLITKV